MRNKSKIRSYKLVFKSRGCVAYPFEGWLPKKVKSNLGKVQLTIIVPFDGLLWNIPDEIEKYKVIILKGDEVILSIDDEKFSIINFGDWTPNKQKTIKGHVRKNFIAVETDIYIYHQ